MRAPWSRLLGLAARQCLRDARAGELRTLFFALLVAVAASSAIGYFGARLNAAMLLRASEFLAADLVLRGSAEADPAQIEAGRSLGLEHARVVEFSSVIATDDALQLAAIKAAAGSYPLRGEVRSAQRPYAREESGGGPAIGEAWVEARLLTALELQVGQNIDVGARTLRIARVLTYEPDRGNGFYSLNPHVLINLGDLAATGVVQPGSRVSYRDLWRGEPERLSAYREALQPTLQANQRVEDIRDENRQIGGALGRAERYLNLASLAAVLLAGVAVAMSAARFARRRFDASALLRCLGLARADALRLYLFELGLVGLFGCLCGALLGWLGQFVLFQLLADLLPSGLPSAGVMPALIGIGTGLVALAGFALPPLAALGRVPPLRVLRRELLPVPPSSWATYGAALLALALIMWRMSLDLRLTLALLGGGVLSALLLGALLDDWQAQLPEDAPNHFVLNLLPDQRDDFVSHLQRLGVSTPPLYPVAPGRLVAINGQPVRERVSKDSRGERAIQRDLSLTWAEQLPSDNRLVAGQWWDATADSGVSVESELAQSLGVMPGDRLDFVIAGRTVQARVSSLREVDWNSFQPNFYMIFSPHTLSDVPVTYLTSFYLEPGHDRELAQLARAFPSITLLPVDALLKQLRDIVAQVTLAVEYVLLFVLAAGLAVLLAALQATLDERVRQGALLRALGARRRLLQQARLREFGLLGACAGLLAALGCEIASALLYRLVFDLQWSPHPWLLLLPVVGAALVALAGLLGTRRALAVSPLRVLREG